MLYIRRIQIAVNWILGHDLYADEKMLMIFE
jgi:hypothetical protein